VKRRDFITLLGGAAAWPLAARAQQTDRVRRVGVLFGGFSETDPEPRARVETFRRHLRELGWTDGRDIHIDLRIGAGDASRVATYAKELIGMTPDVLAANSGLAVEAFARQTRTIPIVFANVFDPVNSGLVASLARPGGNITGFSNFEPALTGKWLELLGEIAPSVTRVAAIFDRANNAYAEFARTMESLAPSFHLQYSSAPVSNSADLQQAIDAVAREPNGGLIVVGGTVASAHREAVVQLAAHHRLPTVYSFGYYPRLGGLISYGVDGVALWQRVGTYVDRILRGAAPADLPVQRPTKFELVINLKTANALSLEVPAILIARADEVIE
jgi:putative ABC transport system substrate-binding protein